MADEPSDVPGGCEPEPKDESSNIEERQEELPSGSEKEEELSSGSGQALSDLFSKGNFSSFFPRIEPPDFSALIPKVSLPDLSAYLPKLDLSYLSAYAPRLDFPDLSAYMPKVELSDLIPALRPMMERIAEAAAPLADLIRENLPHNWPPDIDLDVATTVIRDDGLPLVWVPRAEVIAELLDAPDRRARIEVLISHTDEVVEDCRATLDEVSHESLANQQPLAVKALTAFENGHYEAAQALAVVVTETAVTHFFSGKKYEDIKKEVDFDPRLVFIKEIRTRAALAPIGVFFVKWYPSSGVPAPEALSRHVSVHQADEKHYSRGNAIVAILLVSSVLRALEELREL